MVAFGEHVRATIQRDSDSHPVAHWWQGPNGFRILAEGDESPNPAIMYFADLSRDNAFTKFDVEGREMLARNLAGRAFKLIEAYHATGANKRFLEEAVGMAGPDPLAEYIQNIPEDFDAEEHVAIRPTYRGLIDVDPRIRAEKKKARISAAMIPIL